MLSAFRLKIILCVCFVHVKCFLRGKRLTKPYERARFVPNLANLQLQNTETLAFSVFNISFETHRNHRTYVIVRNTNKIHFISKWFCIWC